MVAAYHLIWTTYGSWLPNDPRGSMSQEIRCAKIAPLGDIHYGRRRIQPAGQVIREFHEAAHGVLKHELLYFTQHEATEIADSFAQTIQQQTYTCYACAIMPDHVHMVIRKHRDKAEKMIEQLQHSSRDALAQRFPQKRLEHPVWGGPGWKVYLNNQDDIQRTIRYVEQNPIKIGRPIQHWGFVKPYDGWLPGQVKVVRRTKLHTED